MPVGIMGCIPVSLWPLPFPCCIVLNDSPPLNSDHPTLATFSQVPVEFSVTFLSQDKAVWPWFAVKTIDLKLINHSKTSLLQVQCTCLTHRDGQTSNSIKINVLPL